MFGVGGTYRIRNVIAERKNRHFTFLTSKNEENTIDILRKKQEVKGPCSTIIIVNIDSWAVLCKRDKNIEKQAWVVRS